MYPSSGNYSEDHSGDHDNRSTRIDRSTTQIDVQSKTRNTAQNTAAQNTQATQNENTQNETALPTTLRFRRTAPKQLVLATPPRGPVILRPRGRLRAPAAGRAPLPRGRGELPGAHEGRPWRRRIA